MKSFYVTIISLLFASVALANEQDASDKQDFETLSDVVLIETDSSKLTLQSLAISMGLSSSDFQTKYKKPTKKELEDLHMRSFPIVVWENPQEIENPHPPANRDGNKKEK